MSTPTCEVCITNPIDGGQRDCGDQAEGLINRIPMCAEHIGEWERDELIEERAPLPTTTNCDNCGSADSVVPVEYDAMVDGPGYVVTELRCAACAGTRHGDLA